ncbi:MAG: hypothetical protein AB7S93_27230 [Xanthobacteraceae bacterium]
MRELGSINVAGTPIDVGPTAEERANVKALARRHALKLAMLVTACWYVFWFSFSINVSALAGPVIFFIACPLAYGFARLMLRRQVAEETRRRRELVKFAMNYRNQQNFSM